MLPKKFSIVVFSVVLMATKCQNQIVITTSTLDKANSTLFNNLATILASCYGDRIDTVGVAGDVPAVLLRTLSVQHSIPVVVIDGTKHKNTHHSISPVKFRRKLQVFIITTESRREFIVNIKNIRQSIWWNHVASFFIIDRSSRCDTATSFLYTAWLNNLLHAKVVCYAEESTKIFSHNPYKSTAPYPWRLLYSGPSGTNHTFTSFYRRYRGNNEVCVELDFDKTKDIGGYPIVIEGLRMNYSSYKNYAFTVQYINTTENILQNAVRALNGMPKYVDLWQYNGWIYGDLRRQVESIVTTWDNILTAYPHTMSGSVIITNFRGHKSQLEKILGIIDVNSRIGLAVVYLITLMFLKFFVRQALIPALLNLVRITCNVSFTNLPDNNASRMYLTGLLFFVVTIQGIYQGKLAALLTTTIPLPDANTIQDLEDFHFKTIYSYHSIKYHIDRPIHLERWVTLNDSIGGTCVINAHRDSLSACIADAVGYYLDQAASLKMHVSERIVSSYNGFWIRWDWPLEQRFNIILSRLVEADVLEPWSLKTNLPNISKLHFDEEVMNNKEFEIIEFGELRFAFVILGIGLACSTVVFIIELAVHRFQSRTLRVRSMYPRSVRRFLP